MKNGRLVNDHDQIEFAACVLFLFAEEVLNGVRLNGYLVGGYMRIG